MTSTLTPRERRMSSSNAPIVAIVPFARNDADNPSVRAPEHLECDARHCSAGTVDQFLDSFRRGRIDRRLLVRSEDRLHCAVGRVLAVSRSWLCGQRLAEVAFEELAACVSRQRLPEDPDPLRDLELGQRRAQEFAKPVLSERCPVSEHDGCTDEFAKTVIRYAEHGCLGNCVMLVDRRLDLAAVDILAAAQHHVLGAIDDEHVAVFVDGCDVTGTEPAILNGLSGRLLDD